MYATLSLKRLALILLWPFGLIVILLITSRGLPSTGTELVRLLSSALTIFGLVLLIVGGSSKRRSPWRWLWKRFPVLNDKLFPDLNGLWVGTTSSNWPVIETMMKAAEATGGVDLKQLDAIALRQDDITVTITASFFSFRVSAQLHGTDSKSHSLTERVCREKRRDTFELYYVYRQDTPSPQRTDEGSHLGAAALDIDLENWCLEGPYWTKRSWRQGLNTAGIIKVARQSR
jgi:hypothetical protein